ncbi:MAG: hypothetical protein Q4F65_05900 [Propionibacteriaceae bacterium]|nr:hypothetical protein [Propionibacteriaceae bacterium]
MDGLDRLSSRFWSAVLERDRLSQTDRLLADVFHGLTGNPHPVLERRERQLEAVARERKKKAIKAAALRRKKALRSARAEQR